MDDNLCYCFGPYFYLCDRCRVGSHAGKGTLITPDMEVGEYPICTRCQKIHRYMRHVDNQARLQADEVFAGQVVFVQDEQGARHFFGACRGCCGMCSLSTAEMARFLADALCSACRDHEEQSRTEWEPIELGSRYA